MRALPLPIAPKQSIQPSPEENSHPSSTEDIHASVPACSKSVDDVEMVMSLFPRHQLALSSTVSTISEQPKFTPREEELEWAAVTPDEMLQIESDLRGLVVGVQSETLAGTADASSDSTECGAGDSSSGKSIAPETDDEREEALLPALEEEIDALPDVQKEAYLAAKIRCPELISEEHKKAFLFKEHFDPKLAAKKLVSHWQYKGDLFGPDKCFLPMTLAGAMSEDLLALSEGFIRLVPAKDDHGRSILFMQPSRLYNANYTRESVLRAFCYLLHLISENPIDRRRGLVLLIYPQGSSIEQFDSVLKGAMKEIIEDYSPTIGRASHLCSPDYMFHLISPIAKRFMGDFMRKRLRVHYGSTDDVLQSLAEYGLHKEQLPIELGGSLHLDTAKWMSKRRLLENTSPVNPLQEIYPDAIVTATKVKASLNGVDSTSSTLGATMDSSSCITPTSSPPPRCDNADESSSEICNIMTARRAKHRKTKQMIPPGDRDTDKKKTKPSGGDPRMNRAIRAKTASPHMSAYDALVAGGFRFPDYGKKGATEKSIMDEEGSVSLYQRKNQLRRRLRTMRMADSRISRAALAKRENPELTMLDALLEGGFQFPDLGTPNMSERAVRDSDGVPLSSRKTELINKIAELKGVSVVLKATSTADDSARVNSGTLSMRSQTIQSGDGKLLEKLDDENTFGICADMHGGSSPLALYDTSGEQDATAQRKDSFMDRISNILEPPESYVADCQGSDSEEGSVNTWLRESEENGDFRSVENCSTSHQVASR